jgi:hypothetical protein
MLKGIALAGIFFFASAFSTAALSNAKPSKGSTVSPTAPAPKGFCFPAGKPC